MRLDRMLDMENAPAWGEGAGSFEADNQHYTHFACVKQAAGRAIGAALACNADARDLSNLLRHRLQESKRLNLMAASAWSLPPRTAGRMAWAVQADAMASLTVPADRIAPTAAQEAERQRRAWADFCARNRRGA